MFNASPILLIGSRRPVASCLALLCVVSFILMPQPALSQCVSSWTITGSGTNWVCGGHLGRSVSSAGDVDGDGFLDLVIGGRRDGTIYDFGRVAVYSGRTHEGIRCFYGPQRTSYDDWSDGFGEAVAGGGDANGDGVPDIAVGSTWYPNHGPVPDSEAFGRVYVFSGADGDTLFVRDGEGRNSNFGAAITFIGDVNSDAHDDILIGSSQRFAPGYRPGRVYVYSGRDGTLLYRLVGESRYGAFGTSVATLGDIDGDSVTDFLVGATGSGLVYLFSGRTGVEIYRVAQVHSESEFGWTVADAGDIDRDGYPDFIVGARFDHAGGFFNGSAYVYSGKRGERIHELAGYHDEDLFGWSVARAGDIDRDGIPEFTVGAMYADNGNLMNAGKAYTFSGRTANLMFEFTGRSTVDLLGFRAVYVGDLDRDGTEEVAVSALGFDGLIWANVWVEDIGRVYLSSYCRVDVDVMPGQCPNVVFPEDRYRVIRPNAARASDPTMLVAAFVGTPTLDVSGIETDAVFLEGVPPLRYEIRDVTAPAGSKETPCECDVRGPDGYDDLVLYFARSAIDSAMHRPTAVCSSNVVNLTAMTLDGQSLIGQDCLVINSMSARNFAGVEQYPATAQLGLINSPNPFNATTTISYTLPAAQNVRLDVYDILGRHVTTLIDGDQDSGAHQMTWDGTNQSGKIVASGVYFYRLTTPSGTQSRKMVLLK